MAGDLILLESTDPFAQHLAESAGFQPRVKPENTGVASGLDCKLSSNAHLLFFERSHWQLYQGVCVLCVATANLFLFDVGIWSFKVQMPTDVVNQQAAISRCG